MALEKASGDPSEADYKARALLQIPQQPRIVPYKGRKGIGLLRSLGKTLLLGRLRPAKGSDSSGKEGALAAEAVLHLASGGEATQSRGAKWAPHEQWGSNAEARSLAEELVGPWGAWWSWIKGNCLQEANTCRQRRCGWWLDTRARCARSMGFGQPWNHCWQANLRTSAWWSGTCLTKTSLRFCLS